MNNLYLDGMSKRRARQRKRLIEKAQAVVNAGVAAGFWRFERFNGFAEQECDIWVPYAEVTSPDGLLWHIEVNLVDGKISAEWPPVRDCAGRIILPLAVMRPVELPRVVQCDAARAAGAIAKDLNRRVITDQAHVAVLRAMHACAAERNAKYRAATTDAEALKEMQRRAGCFDDLLAALKEMTPSMPPVDAPCHYGIVSQENCWHCERIAKAHAAIAKAEGAST